MDKSPLEMTDEEVMAMPSSEFEITEEPEQDEVEETPEEAPEEPEEEPDTDEGESNDEPDEAPDNEPESEEEGAEPEEKAEPAVDPAIAPLKAHGRTININSVDELRQLAQMGVDYTKKMQSLAPSLKIVKMLEKQGLLDEAKLSRLIDLDKKSPEAISNLVKESGIDPLDIDLEKADSYRPNNYAVPEKEMALDNVLKELEHTETFQTTVDLVAKQWDQESRNQVLDNPAILKDLNSHIQIGLYDRVADEVERQKALGYLGGVDNLTSYKRVGDAMHKAGMFNDLMQPQAQQQPPTQPTQQESPATDKKKAAALTKGKRAKVKKPAYDPLNMSDDEFEKIANMKF